MIIAILVTFIDLLVLCFNLLIFVRVIMSWLPKARDSRAGQLVFELTEPFLLPIRKLVPMGGMIDLAPLIAFVMLQLLQTGAHTLLAHLV